MRRSKNTFSKIALWQWSLCLTLPLTICFFVWAKRTIDLYSGIRYEFCSPLANSDEALWRAGQVSFFEIFREFNQAFFVQRYPADVNIYISQAGLNNLYENIPYSGRQYQEGIIAYPDGDYGKIGLRLRGDCSYHWLFSEKSFKFKTSKKKLWHGRRIWNLVIPKSDDMIMNHYNYKFAKLIGVLAPESQLVSVNINGKHQGLRFLVEQLDEAFLRRNHLMPNDLYFGDNFFKGQFYGITNDLFASPLAWEKEAINNHHPDDHREPINQLIRDIQAGKTELLDLPTFARFSLFIDISKASHISSTNNWRLYYDSYREKFFPIVWDAGGWFKEYYDRDHDQIQLVTSQLMAVLHKDKNFMQEKYRAIKQFYDGQDKQALALLDEELNLAKRKLTASPFYFFVNTYHQVVSKKEILQAMDEFSARVRESFEFYKKHMLKTVEDSKPVLADKVWQGRKVISSHTEIRENIKILPGTKILIAPGQALRFLGRVTAVGTAKNPVYFGPLDPQKPFGSVVIKDELANGSLLESCIFKNGSGFKGALFEYIGMLSVHNVKNLTINNCQFERNFETDDMIHVVYSDVKISQSIFKSSLADALDADISNLDIMQSQFENAGNDALDIMDTKALVRNTVFLGSKDKGISVGEGSQLIAVNSRFEQNNIGVEVKDSSTADLANVEFWKNDKPLNAYRKNWQYGKGGTIRLRNSIIAKNKQPIGVDKKSSIKLIDSFIEPLPMASKRLTLEDVDSENLRNAQAKRSLGPADRFPASIDNFTNPQIRGNFRVQ